MAAGVRAAGRWCAATHGCGLWGVSCSAGRSPCAAVCSHGPWAAVSGRGCGPGQAASHGRCQVAGRSSGLGYAAVRGPDVAHGSRDVWRGGRLLAVAAQRGLFLVVAGGRQLFSMAWGRWLFAPLSWCPATGRVRHPVMVFVWQFTVAVAASAWGRQLVAVVTLNRRLFMVTAAAGYLGCALCLR